MIEHVLEGCQCDGKRCAKCEEVRCIGAYYRRSRSRDGMVHSCKNCLSSQKKKRYRENVEQIKSQSKEYYLKNADRIKSQKKEYYLKNADRIKGQKSSYQKSHSAQIHVTKQAYRKAHPEIHRKAVSKWRRNHSDRVNINSRKHYWNNVVQHRRRKLAYQKANPEKMRANAARRRTRKTKAGGSYTVAEWQALKAKYNDTCLCCGRREPIIKLTADHVIPVIKGGSSEIGNIQPLCLPCNKSKYNKTIDYRKGKHHER